MASAFSEEIQEKSKQEEPNVKIELNGEKVLSKCGITHLTEVDEVKEEEDEVSNGN